MFIFNLIFANYWHHAYVQLSLHPDYQSSILPFIIGISFRLNQPHRQIDQPILLNHCIHQSIRHKLFIKFYYFLVYKHDSLTFKEFIVISKIFAYQECQQYYNAFHQMIVKYTQVYHEFMNTQFELDPFGYEIKLASTLIHLNQLQFINYTDYQFATNFIVSYPKLNENDPKRQYLLDLNQLMVMDYIQSLNFQLILMNTNSDMWHWMRCLVDLIKQLNEKWRVLWGILKYFECSKLLKPLIRFIRSGNLDHLLVYNVNDLISDEFMIELWQLVIYSNNNVVLQAFWHGIGNIKPHLLSGEPI
eukprot:NODE_167_length_14562_cov_0.357256.p5 type:complete len:303 gc:universal NODE_167_length_14562_cov_0.357256:6036-5128(-)